MITHYIIDNMAAKRVMISVSEDDFSFLTAHPEISKSELFRKAVREYRKKYFQGQGGMA